MPGNRSGICRRSRDIKRTRDLHRPPGATAFAERTRLSVPVRKGDCRSPCCIHTRAGCNSPSASASKPRRAACDAAPGAGVDPGCALARRGDVPGPAVGMGSVASKLAGICRCISATRVVVAPATAGYLYEIADSGSGRCCNRPGKNLSDARRLVRRDVGVYRRLPGLQPTYPGQSAGRTPDYRSRRILLRQHQYADAHRRHGQSRYSAQEGTGTRGRARCAHHPWSRGNQAVRPGRRKRPGPRRPRPPGAGWRTYRVDRSGRKRTGSQGAAAVAGQQGLPRDGLYRLPRRTRARSWAWCASTIRWKPSMPRSTATC